MFLSNFEITFHMFSVFGIILQEFDVYVQSLCLGQCRYVNHRVESCLFDDEKT